MSNILVLYIAFLDDLSMTTFFQQSVDRIINGIIPIDIIIIIILLKF